MSTADIIIAIATCGYFILTIFILLNMRKSLKEYKSQVELGRKQILLTFRPYLDLRIVSWQFAKLKPVSESVKCTFEVDIYNTGKSPIQIYNPHLEISFSMPGAENQSWGSSSNLLKHAIMNFEVNQNGKLVFPLTISRAIWDMVSETKFKPYCTVEINMETTWELESTPKLLTRTFYLTLEEINEENGVAKFSYRALESKPPSALKVDLNEYLKQVSIARKKYNK